MTVTSFVTLLADRGPENVGCRFSVRTDVEIQRRVDILVSHQLLQDGRPHAGRPTRAERPPQVVSARRPARIGIHDDARLAADRTCWHVGTPQFKINCTQSAKSAHDGTRVYFSLRLLNRRKRSGECTEATNRLWNHH